MSSSTSSDLKRPNRSLGITLAIFALIIGFVGGEEFGKSRHSSTVDQAIATVVKKDPLAPKKYLLERAAIEAVLKATGDRWSNYFPAGNAGTFKDELLGRYSGAGIWLRKSASGVLEISSVQQSSPASRSGIKVRDLLLAIDGVDVGTQSVATAVAALRGEPNTKVHLLLERDQKSYSATILRSSILTGDVVASQLESQVLYLQISALSAHASDDVATALQNFPHSKGIVLDLRDNPGGLIDVAVSVVSQFLNSGTVVSYSRKGENDVVLSSTNDSPDSSPMTVLINRSTASSAEVIAGALQDRNRAVILGETSYGKGTVQEVVGLMDGSQLEVTVGKYRTPSGRLIDGVGIQPDLAVSETQEIPKAVQVLSGLASLDNPRNLQTK